MSKAKRPDRTPLSHLGPGPIRVAELRMFKVDDFRDLTEPRTVIDGNSKKPLAVLVPYKLFIDIQEALGEIAEFLQRTPGEE